MVYTVFIDLDDTLLNREKKISDYTLEALRRFQMLGNNIVFATARSKQLHGLQECLKTITPHLIFHNGGEIVSNGKTIFQGYFSKEETERIGRYLTVKQIKAAVILDDAYYANYDAPAIWGQIRNYAYTSFEIAEFQAPKFSLLLEDESQEAALDALNDQARITLIDNHTGAILAPKNVSKGAAVRIMLDRMFPESKSIFIGNDYNDLSGFAQCDIKVAVANAEPGLLDQADVIIGSNNDNGVARFLHDLCGDEKRYSR